MTYGARSSVLEQGPRAGPRKCGQRRSLVLPQPVDVQHHGDVQQVADHEQEQHELYRG
ncbi:hypothetical protein [Kitasatospora griseola]|uniref:hypothetical protein n=1 Tax=Kitasatospora griseola TaxID=2064 RepID=UPI0038002BCA